MGAELSFTAEQVHYGWAMTGHCITPCAWRMLEGLTALPGQPLAFNAIACHRRLVAISVRASRFLRAPIKGLNSESDRDMVVERQLAVCFPETSENGFGQLTREHGLLRTSQERGRQCGRKADPSLGGGNAVTKRTWLPATKQEQPRCDARNMRAYFENVKPGDMRFI